MSGPPPQNPAQAVRVLQIITFAMIIGAATFLGFALLKNKFGIGGQPNQICWIAIGFAVAVFLLHLVVPKLSMNTQIRMLDAAELSMLDEEDRFLRVFPIFQTGHIVACALLEGAAFFNAFAYFSTTYIGSLATVIVLLVLMLVRFPTLNSSEFWVQDRIAELESGR